MSHSPHPLTSGYTQEYQPDYSSYPAPYQTQSPPPPTHHDPYTAPSHPIHTLSPPPPPPPLQQQQPHVAFAHRQSFAMSDMHVPPPPPLHNQSSAATFQYDDADNDLGDAGDLPLLRAPSARSQESVHLNMPGNYNAVPSDDDMNNNIRYGRIPQRVPRRNKTLKRVECVFFLLLPLTTSPCAFAGSSMATSCSTLPCRRNCSTSAPTKTSASSHICAIRPRRATRTTSRTTASRCARYIMTRPAGRSCSSS